MAECGGAMIPMSSICCLSKNDTKGSISEVQEFHQQIRAYLYISTNTRPDLALSVDLQACHASNPSQAHFMTLKVFLDFFNRLRLTIECSRNHQSK
jgi:hypothetical protein